MQEKEKQIRELFNLTMEIAVKTEHRVSFEIMTQNDLTSLYVFDIGEEGCRKIGDIYLCSEITNGDDYKKIKKYLQGLLKKEAA